ncbi:MAG: hypothetical protein V1495_03010 [Pseudomonadota bacterium]
MPTKKSTLSGSVETAILLPLLLLCVWGAGLVSLLLLKKSRAEQSAWVVGSALSHGVPPELSFRLGSKTARSAPPEFAVRERRDCVSWFVLPAAGDLPISFRGALLANCPWRADLRGQGGMPTEFWRPGGSFAGSRAVRQLLWQEAMQKAGFGALPLQMLAVPELSSVTGVDLGGSTASILNNSGGAE